MDYLLAKDRRILTKLAFWSTLLMLAIIPVRIMIFSIWPMPTSATECIEMFQTHPAVSMLHLDLLCVINNALLCIIYLGLFALLPLIPWVVFLELLAPTLFHFPGGKNPSEPANQQLKR